MLNKKIRKIFGDNVRFYRYLHHYTQEQLIEYCNLSTRYISDIEYGKGNVSLDMIEKIAICFKIEPYILLK